MAHYVMSHSSYIFRNHIAAMLDKRIGSGCLGKSCRLYTSCRSIIGGDWQLHESIACKDDESNLVVVKVVDQIFDKMCIRDSSISAS